jgi:hypothetical protein
MLTELVSKRSVWSTIDQQPLLTLRWSLDDHRPASQLPTKAICGGKFWFAVRLCKRTNHAKLAINTGGKSVATREPRFGLGMECANGGNLAMQACVAFDDVVDGQNTH